MSSPWRTALFQYTTFFRSGRIGRKSERRGSPRRSMYDFKPEGLLALRLAFLVGRRQRRRPDVDRAGLGRVDVVDVRGPTVRGRVDGRRGVARRLGEDRKSV